MSLTKDVERQSVRLRGRRRIADQARKPALLTSAVAPALETLEGRVLLSVSHTDFSDLSDLQLNGTAATLQTAGTEPVTVTTTDGTTAKALQLTDLNAKGSEASSVFTLATQPVDTFDTTFDFTFGTTHTADADGFTFTLQNSAAGPAAIGGGGGSLGYAGLTTSLAVKFKLYPGVDTTGIYAAGDTPSNNVVTNPTTTALNPEIAVDLTKKPDGSASGIDFHAHGGDRYECHLVYGNGTLTETVTDLDSQASVTQKYAIQLPGAVGGHEAYVGFTGADGGAIAEQDILNWTYTGTENTNPITLPTPVLSGSPGLPGNATLNWGNFTNSASGVTVLASTDGGKTYTDFADLTAGTNTYQATGLDTTKTYQFEVQEVGDGTTFVNSAASNAITIPGSGLNSPPIQHFDFSSASDMQLNGNAKLTGQGVPPVANPTAAPTLAQAAGTGLAPGTYYVQYTWHSTTNEDTAASPESNITLTSGNGVLNVTPPSTFPANVDVADVFIGTTSGGEMFSGSVASGKTLAITALPATGARTPPATNRTFQVPPNALELVNNTGNQTSSAFGVNPQLINTFDTTFDFNFGGDVGADGFTFTIQGNNPTISGGGGGGLGYAGIPSSVAVLFNLYNNVSETGINQGGNGPKGADIDVTKDASGNPTGIDFHANPNDVYEVHLVYDGTTLHETLTDTTQKAAGKTAVFTNDFTIDIVKAVGGPTAYVGFTAASGGAWSEMDIRSWTFPTATNTVTDVINDATGGQTITLAKDTDGTDLDVTYNGATLKMPLSDPKGLTINDTGLAADTIQVNSNALPNLLNLNGTFTVQGITAVPTGSTIDLNKSTVTVVGSGLLPAVQGLIKSGQIKSSAVSANPGYAIADVVTGSGVQLSYRLLGDLNGDGKVNFSDLVALAASYNTQSGADWAHGDFNYDGKVNFSDLVALAASYGKTAAATAAATSSGQSSAALSAGLALVTKSSARQLSPAKRRR